MSDLAPQICIGPVRFVLSSRRDQELCYSNWAYEGFFDPTDRDHDGSHQITLPVEISESLPVTPRREPDFVSGRNWALWDEGDVMHFCSGFHGRERPRFACELSSSLAHCALYVDGPISESPLRYPLDQILTWGLLSRCNGLLLHSAAVVRDGVGYVLAGRSGAGKSTLSGFCREQGWDVLNDDRVIVHPDEQGVWQVSGTPWHGSGCYAAPRTVPLHGLYVLEQDERNQSVMLSSREAQFALLDVAAIAWFSDSWSQAALDTLSRLCKGVAVNRLHFMRSPDAVDQLGAVA